MIKPTAPKITGLPKIHKADMPVRPVINFTTAPAYKIAKYLNNWLLENLKIDNDTSVKNNMELTDKIISTEIPKNGKLASFDVTNMYSNIPVAETIKITRNLLRQNNVNENKIDEVITLLDVISKQNYFEFNNKFYEQTDGLPMGSPLSGTLANIYLNHFEKTHVNSNSNKYKNNIIYWHRYVDDVLILFNGTNRQLENLHTYINSIHTKIQFTLEKEENKTINFLDLTIKNENQRHTFKIFRKRTQTNHTIHNSSHHPAQHKIAAYNHMLHRLNNIPMSDDDYNDEIRTITQIATKNGYSERMIHRINRKIKSRIIQRDLSTLYENENNNNNKKYLSMYYNENTSNIARKIFNNYGYTLSHKTNNTLSKRFKYRKHNDNTESGIYKLTCNDCPKFYIGQTGRTFAQRFKEHTQEVMKANTGQSIKSNYAEHLIKERHTYTDIETNLQILQNINKSKYMNRKEEYEIYKERNNPAILNDKINTKTNKIYEYIEKLR